MSTEQRRIFAFSGILKPRPGGPPPGALVNFAIGLAAASRPVRRLCYIPTAVGDRQDAIDRHAARFADRDDIEFSVLRLFTQPSVPDIRAHLLSQDVILVEGGSVVNLIAVWRAHGLPQVLRECWEAGTVLTGPPSASSSRTASCPPDTRPKTASDCSTPGRPSSRPSPPCPAGTPGTSRPTATGGTRSRPSPPASSPPPPAKT